MNHYKSILLISILIGTNLFSFAENDQADARYLNITKVYTLQEDGSVQFEYKHTLRFDSYFAIHRRYGETNVLYDTNYQKVKVNYAYTDNEGRKRVNTPDNAKVEILPYMAQNAPFYNNLRQLIIVQTALELGSVATVSYTLNSNAEFMKHFSVNERILQSTPTDELIIIIRVPDSRNITFKMRNTEVEPSIQKAEGVTEYMWIFKDLEAYQHEAMQQHPSCFEPWLQFSTVSLKNEYYAFMDQPAFKYNLNPAMENWIDQIYDKSRDEFEFILNLQKKVVNEFRTYDIPLKANGGRLQSAEEVFVNSGGNRLEKAIFMVACLQRKGIKAFPVMSSSSALVDADIGDLEVFDHFMVRTNTIAEEFVYFPVDKIPHNNLRFSLQDQVLLPFYTGVNNFELIREPLSVNKLSIIGNIELFENDGKKSLIHIQASNNAVPFYIFRGNIDQEINRFFNHLKTTDNKKKPFCFSDIFKAKRNKILTLNQNTFSADLKMASTPSALTEQSPYFFFCLPESNYGLTSFNFPLLNPQRKTPLMLPATIQESYDYQIRLPKDYQFQNTDVTKTLTFEIGTIDLDIKTKKHTLLVKKSLSINKTEIALKDYADFLDMIHLWNSKEANTIVIKKLNSEK